MLLEKKIPVNTNWPKVSIVIPTLNASSVIIFCLESIVMQDYPKDKIEIIISDGGSTDGTQDLAKKYGTKVISNKLKTAEAGKAVGVRASTGDYIALIDSDNILPDKNWIQQMIKPLMAESEAVGSEPWEYTWREQDGFITRYCALIGMNDPLVHFLGNYDRMNLLTGKWTEVVRDEVDKGDYLVNKFDKRGLPTIGANGAVFRAVFLKDNLEGAYLFDIDILAKHIKEKGEVIFIKVKNGIIHTYCEANIGKFAKKQRRRIKDYLYHKFEAKDREFEWESKDASGEGSAKNIFALFIVSFKNNIGLLRFVLSCITVLPLIFAAFRGYKKKKDLAWFFHPLACEITLWEYGKGAVMGIFKKEEISRKNWSQ